MRLAIFITCKNKLCLKIAYRFREIQKAATFAREDLKADRLVADEASSATSLFKQAILAAADLQRNAAKVG